MTCSCLVEKSIPYSNAANELLQHLNATTSILMQDS